MAQEFDGFEVGDADLTNGDGAYWGGGAKAANGSLVGNEAGIVFQGAFSAKLNWTAVSTGDTYCRRTPGAATNTRYVQSKIRVEATGSNATNQMHCMDNVTSVASVCRYDIVTIGSTYKINVIFQRVAGSTTLTGTTTLNMGQWYTLEVQYVSNNASTGGAAYWIGGVQEGSSFASDTTQANSIPDRPSLGLNFANSTTGTIYFDNYINSDTYIGLLTGADDIRPALRPWKTINPSRFGAWGGK